MKLNCEYGAGILEISKVHGDESGWSIIYNSDGVFRLYELPLYGGEPRLIDTYANFHLAFEDGQKFT